MVSDPTVHFLRPVWSFIQMLVEMLIKCFVQKHLFRPKPSNCQGRVSDSSGSPEHCWKENDEKNKKKDGMTGNWSESRGWLLISVRGFSQHWLRTQTVSHMHIHQCQRDKQTNKRGTGKCKTDKEMWYPLFRPHNKVKANVCAH